MDWATTITLIFVWTFLTLGCLVLLFFARFAAKTDSEGGADVTGDEVIGTIGLSSFPILLATVLNEVLVERCWRRVVYSALGHDASTLDNATMAKNLRAANFEWVNVVKRLFTWELSLQDLRVLISYILVRWGTAISIASIQLSVSWKPAHPDTDVLLYTASRRYVWFIVPALIHAFCIFGTMAIWLMPPWRFFSARFDDHGLLERYSPYLQRVSGGSVAKFEAVAKNLDPCGEEKPSLKKSNAPGVQFLAKMKGIWLGLLCMNIPPALAYVYFQSTDRGDVLRLGIYRFAFHLVFLAQNIFYLLALDFAVWNVSLEGFCKQTRGRPNKTLRHLGYSSGMMLLVKAFKQRRPIRAALFMWLFWLQACLMRFLTVLYVLCITVLSYGTFDDRDEFYDPNFWLGWGVMSALFIIPLFCLWLFTEFQAPICEQDGWRWAKIAQNALCEDGYYGVKNGEAVWAVDVEPFNSCKGVILS